MTYHISTKIAPITFALGAGVPSIGVHCCHIIVDMGCSQLVEVWVVRALYKVAQGRRT
jgi:hypothetical protein